MAVESVIMENGFLFTKYSLPSGNRRIIRRGSIEVSVSNMMDVPEIYLLDLKMGRKSAPAPVSA